MDYVSGIAGGVKDMFDGMNPATLSGANDVVVVRQPDGSFKSSPFHVRFGKLNVWSPSDKKVKIFINRQQIEQQMKLGSRGEAFFVRDGPPLDGSSAISSTSGSPVLSPMTSPMSGRKFGDPGTKAVSNDAPGSMSAAAAACRIVRLERGPQGFFGCTLEPIPGSSHGISVASVLDTTATGEDAKNKINIGDIVMSINGIVMADKSLDAALKVVEAADDNLVLILAEPTPANTDQSENVGWMSRLSGLFRSGSASPTIPADGIYVRDLSPSLLAEVSGGDVKDASYGNQTITVPPKNSVSGPSSPPSPKAGFKDIGMSLCGLDDTASFEEHRISPGAFSAEPELLMHNGLVVCLDGNFYSWAVAAPMIMSVVSFGISLPTGSQAKLEDEDRRKREAEDSWWRLFVRRGEKPRSRTASATEPNSPGTSPPSDPEGGGDSPKSGEIDTEAATRMFRELFYHSSITLTSDEIAALELEEGANQAHFVVTSKLQGRATVSCFVYLWNYDDQIVVSDIDGTITKSDMIGHAANIFGRDWTHSGIAGLYSSILNNGYKFMYLTSRSIGHAPLTRDYLWSVRQGEQSTPLPRGPALFSPESFFAVLNREVIARKPQEYKIACLSSIMDLFPKRDDGSSCFNAGFGNRHTDELSYVAVKVPADRVFTVDTKGNLKIGSAGGGGSVKASTYSELKTWGDHFFPPVIKAKSNSPSKTPFKREYTDTNFWVGDRGMMQSINIDAELAALDE